VDSHAHLQCQAGAVVAQARFSDLDGLCNWFIAMCTQAFEIGTGSGPYELACLYVRE